MEPPFNRQRLADELDNLRSRLGDFESRVEGSLSEATDSALRSVRRLVGPEPVDPERREHLIRHLAELKSRRRGDNQALTHWLEAEEEVDMLLRLLGLSGPHR